MDALYPLAHPLGSAAARRPQSRPLVIWVIALALLGFHMQAPLHDIMFGPHGGYGISLEFFTTLPLVLFGIAGWTLVSGGRGRWALYAYAAFVAWVILASLIVPPESYRMLLAPIAHLAILCGAAYLFRWHWPAIHRRLPLVFLLIVFGFLGWAGYMWLTGRIRLLTSGGLTRTRFGDIRSTQATRYLGVQFCYLLYLLDTTRNRRALYLALIAVYVVLVFVIGARAAIVGFALLGCAYLYSRRLSSRLAAAVIVAAVLIVSWGIILPYVEALTEKATSLLELNREENVRLRLYDLLLYYAREYPLFGVGHGRFIELNRIHFTGAHPHQNVLGRACENGIPAGLLYLAFVGLAIWTLRPPSPRSDESPVETDARRFIRVCLWVLLYLQWRGLFQDNWTLKENLFAVGAGIGVHRWLAAVRARRRAAARPAPGPPSA
jgi:hypothetical protein